MKEKSKTFTSQELLNLKYDYKRANVGKEVLKLAVLIAGGVGLTTVSALALNPHIATAAAAVSASLCAFQFKRVCFEIACKRAEIEEEKNQKSKNSK